MKRLALVLLALGGPVGALPAQEIVAHWPFEEGSGSTTADVAGSQPGTLVGAAWAADTPNGSAHSLDFDGVDDRVDVGTIDLDGEALTIACWFRPDTFATRDARLVSKATGVQAQQHYWMLSTNAVGGEFRLRFRLKAGGNTTTLVASGGALTPGVWTHAAAVYDGSFMRIYKDGIEVGSVAKAGLVDAAPAVSASIGRQPAGAGGQAFDGRIDDVRLYRAALSGPEIQALISGGNQVPVAGDDSYQVDTDDVLVVDSGGGVLANDSDLDFEPLSAQLVGDVAHGVLALAPDGSFSYTPDPGYAGPDFFTYRASDGTALSNLATASIQVLPPPGADLIAHYRFDEGVGSTAGDSSGSNDGSIVGAGWTVATGDGSPFALNFDGSDDRVDIGTLDVQGSGLTIACWMRPDAFGIRDARLVSKATGTSSQAHYWMLSTIFDGPNPTLRFRLKTGGNTSTLIGSGGTLSTGSWVHAAAVYDGSAMRLYLDGVEIGSIPKSGAVDQNAAVAAAIGRQPLGAGQQPFDGAIDDVRIYNRGLSAAEIGALIGANQPPVVQNDSYPLDSDTTLTVDAAAGVLANDSDPEMGALQAQLASDVSNGSLTLDPDGGFSYTPTPGFAGEDQFTYRASDGNSVSAPATVTLVVTSPFGLPPVALADSYQIEADGNLLVTATAGVLANDTDPDSDPLTAVLESDVSDGVLVLSDDGAFSYAPNPGFSGTDSFSYRANDGFFASDPALVTLSVTAPPGEELEAHWRFDGGVGPIAVDSSGLGRDGMLVGPDWVADTVDGSAYALSFDGVDDRVDLGAFDVSGEALTIACWMRPDAFSIRDARLLSKATGVQENDHYWMLSTIFRGPDPTLRFRLKTGGDTTTLIAATGELTPGVWSHAAAVYDGAFMRLYLDGVEVGSVPKVGPLSVDPTVQVSIGHQPPGAGNQPFQGLIDDVRVYRRALGQLEIDGLASVDGPLPRTDFASPGQSASESGGARSVVVNLSSVGDEDAIIPFTVSGTAAAGDFFIDPSPLVIPAGQLSGSITVTPIDDGDFENDETVVITLGTPSGSIPGSLLEHTLTLVDDDVPTGSLVSDDFNACNLAGFWTFVDPVGDATMSIRGVGTDDAQLTMSVPEGVHNAFDTLTVPYISQPIVDGDFEVIVKFDSAVTGSIQDQGILVLEDTANWLRFDVYSSETTMNAFAASTVAGDSTIELNGAIGSSLAPVWLRLTRIGDDWTFAWSSDGTNFSPVGGFTHVIAAADLAIYAGNNGVAHTAVVDYVFNAASPLSPEDGTPAGGGGVALSVATSGSGSVTRGPDQPLYYCDEDVQLTAVPQPGWVFDRWEGDLTGGVNPDSVTMSSARNVTAVFVPSSSDPEANFAIASQSVAEDGPVVAVTVNLTAPATSQVTLPYSVGGTASNPGDFTVTPATLVIPVGQSSASILLDPVDDAVIDPGETVILTLGTPTNATLGATTVYTATLIDDDGAQLVSDDFNSCGLAGIWTFYDQPGDGSFATVGPGTDDAQLVLSVPAGIHDAYDTLAVPYVSQAIPDTDFEIDVKFDSIVSGSIQDQGILILEDLQNWLRFDFYSSGSSMFFFAASTVAGSSTSEANINLGSTSAPTWMRINRTGDLWTVSWSSDGAFFSQLLTLSHSLVAQEAGVYVGNSGPAHTAIVDYFFDTGAPIVPEDGAVSGATGRTLTVMTTGSGTVSQDIEQATFYCSESVTLTATPATGWLFDRWEGDLTGSANPQSVTMSADRNVTAVFVPDNALPSVGFAIVSMDIAEDGGSLAVSVVLSDTSGSPVTVPYSVSGTATGTADYSIDAGPLVIPAGQMSENIVVNVVSDGDDESDETVIVTLGTPTNANLLGITQFTATILDDDDPTVQFAAAAQNVPEEGGAVNIEVQLSSAVAQTVTVPYTVGGSASDPADYDIDDSPLMFSPGQTSRNIVLTPVDDGTEESDETVVVLLGTPVNAGLGATTVHTATLLDDDGPPVVDFVSAGQSVGEGDGSTVVAVQLSKPATSLVTIPYSLSGTASQGGDYSTTPNPLQIGVGQSTGNITVNLVDDSDEDPGETVVLTLGTPTNGVLGTSLVHTVTILDNDGVAPISDDFSAANLRQDIWTFIDPLGDATLQVVGNGTLDAQLVLSVPADVPHEAWTPLNVPRVMQSVPDADLQVEAKFESNLTTAFQNDGLIFDQEDGLNWVRFDFRYNGSQLQAYASTTVNDSPSTRFAVNISPGPWNNPSPLFMRITRSGNLWTFEYSFDGGNWSTAGSFSQALTLSAVGPFCGNAGTRPAHTTVVDYFFNTAAPIAMEDFGTPVDTTVPFVYRSSARPLNDTAIEVSWETDELATGALEYGETLGYELGFWGSTQPADYEHTFVVTGLDFDTEYFFRIVSEDPSMNVALVPNLSAATFPEGFTEGPNITFWYGQEMGGMNVQRFGHLGVPQNWVNILGNVTDLNGSVDFIKYQIPGQSERFLSMGPDVLWDQPWRLAKPGDFNADIAPGDLSPGNNDILFTAEDDEGNVTVEVCRVDFTTGVVWPQSYSVDWSTVTDIQDVAQVVDGEWTIEDDPFRPGEKVLRNPVVGYDRLVAIGDLLWDNYEVVVPITINGFPEDFNPVSNSYAAGFILRWPGHSGPETQQPRPGFFPFGGLFAYRWYSPTDERWNHYGTNFSPNVFSTQNPLPEDVPMIMKARVQTLGDNTRRYQLRVWPDGMAEPGTWFIDRTHGAGTGTDGGSLLLLSNYVDVSFGNITVTPLP